MEGRHPVVGPDVLTVSAVFRRDATIVHGAVEIFVGFIVSDNLICRRHRTICMEKSFIFGNVENYKKFVHLAETSEIPGNVQRFEGIVGQTGVAVVTFDLKYFAWTVQVQCFS